MRLINPLFTSTDAYVGQVCETALAHRRFEMMWQLTEIGIDSVMRAAHPLLNKMIANEITGHYAETLENRLCRMQEESKRPVRTDEAVLEIVSDAVTMLARAEILTATKHDLPALYGAVIKTMEYMVNNNNYKGFESAKNTGRSAIR